MVKLLPGEAVNEAFNKPPAPPPPPMSIPPPPPPATSKYSTVKLAAGCSVKVPLPCVTEYILKPGTAFERL
jgi:hypothetical protein